MVLDRTSASIKNEQVGLWTYLAIFFAVLTLYALSSPYNHVESVDRFGHLILAKSENWGGTDNSRKVLYKLINRLTYLAVDFLNIGLKLEDVITARSMLFGAGSAVAMTAFLSFGFNLSRMAAVLGGLLLSVSYGIWRFSVEVEVYSGAMLLFILSLLFTYRNTVSEFPKLSKFAASGILCGVTVSFYLPTMFAMIISIPIILLSRRLLLQTFVHLAFCFVTIVTVYLTAYLYLADTSISISGLYDYYGQESSYDNSPIGFSSILRASLAASSVFLSTNWLFAFDAVSTAVASRFPGYEREVLIWPATRFKPYVFVPVLLTPVFVFLFAKLALSARTIVARSKARLTLFFVFSLLLHGAVVMWLDPGVIDVWVLAVPAVVVLFTVLVLEPSIQSGSRRSAISLVIVVALWNWFGGVGMFKSEAGDYYAAESAWLRKNLRDDDLVIMSSTTYRHRKYFDYNLPGEVLVLGTQCGPGGPEAAIRQMAGARAAASGRIFVTQAFVEPPKKLESSQNCETRSETALALFEAVRDDLRQVNDNGPFSIYEIVR